MKFKFDICFMISAVFENEDIMDNRQLEPLDEMSSITKVAESRVSRSHKFQHMFTSRMISNFSKIRCDSCTFKLNNMSNNTDYNIVFYLGCPDCIPIIC